jgi:hypothetical protein
MSAKIRVPKYCRLRHANGYEQAYINWGKKKHYLGEYGTPDSRRRYHTTFAGRSTRTARSCRRPRRRLKRPLRSLRTLISKTLRSGM